MYNPVPVLPPKVYDFLKWVALVLLPALATLYIALSGVLHLPNADEVSGAIIAVDAFLGAILNLSSKAYNSSSEKYDGVVEVDHEDDKIRMSSEDVQAAVARGKKEVTLKVVKKKRAPALPKASRRIPKGR